MRQFSAIEMERGTALCEPECGHPTLKVGRVQASNVERGIARVDVDFLASWRPGLCHVGGENNAVGLTWFV